MKSLKPRQSETFTVNDDLTKEILEVTDDVTGESATAVLDFSKVSH